MLDNEILLQQLRNEQTRETAFQSLIENYYVTIQMLAYNIIKDHRTAQDIAQDVFAKFWKNKPFMATDIQSFYAYLMRSCRNACNDYLEMRQKELQGKEQLRVESKTCVEPNFISGDVSRYLALLSKQQREVVRRVVIQDLSYKDTAAIMGLSRHTVKLHFRNAMKVLRGIFP